MYNKLSASYRKRQIYNSEDEPPKKKLISDADIFIKSLAQKQRNTKTSLEEQLSLKQDFHKANEFVSLTNYTAGPSNLEEFNSVVAFSDEIEELKTCGLTNEEIELFFDHKKGEEYFKQKHKKINENILNEQIECILTKINNRNDDLRKTTSCSRLDTELLLSEKPNSIETKLLKFALESQQKSREATPHPMDNLKNIEIQLNEDLTSLNFKKIRRKVRSLQKHIDLLNNAEITEPKINKSSCSLSKNSKWDIKDLDNKNTCKYNTTIKKNYFCKPQNLYTIKDNQIVKINKEEHAVQDEESKINVRKKLTIDEILEMPKFSNYSPGKPSKTLYLKNLCYGITEENLIEIFNEFTKEKILSVKILKGKMHGQAFVELENESVAEKVLQACNGVVFKNKPIIILFGKCEKT